MARIGYTNMYRRLKRSHSDKTQSQANTKRSIVNLYNDGSINHSMDIIPPTPRERYRHLKDPELRRKSFHKWSFANSQKTSAFIKYLIDEGFFSIDEEQKNVQCVYCGGVLTGIKDDENIHIEHYRHFPKCERFKWRELDFLTLFSHHQASTDDLTVSDSMVSTTAQMAEVTIRNKEYVSTSDSEPYLDGRERDSSHPSYTDGSTKFPRHTYYALYVDRLRTFKNWPQDSCQSPETLAKAGLFYAGVEDVCECYCCGGQLEGWEPGDKPQEEHDKWFSTQCPLSTARYIRSPSSP